MKPNYPCSVQAEGRDQHGGKAAGVSAAVDNLLRVKQSVQREIFQEVQIVGKFDEQADQEEKERDTGAEGQRALEVLKMQDEQKVMLLIVR